MTFSLDGATIDGCVDVEVGDDNRGFCENLSLEQGQYTIKAEYSGTGTIDPSSTEGTLTIGEDLVHGQAFQQYLTFYPVKDGYRDTIAISAERGEPITATIRIYGPKGARIKTVTFAEGTTPVSYRWNGRYASGALRPEGTYGITVTLVDAFGTTAVAVGSVKLSHKKLIWHTKTIERAGDTADDSGGHIGSAFIYSGHTYIKIVPSTGSGQASWDFAIPSATVYSSLTFKAYARHDRTTGDGTVLGLENFTVPGCPTVVASLPDISCFGGRHPLGNAAGTTDWFSSAKVTSASYRYGRLARGIVFGTKKVTYVYKVRLVVRYATLGY
jgi:hypothetical protein